MGILPNPWVILGLVGFFLVSLAGTGTLAYMRGRDDVKAAQTKQELQQTKGLLDGFVRTADGINAAALEFGGISHDLSTNIGVISRDFHNAARNNPLPVDCKPDAFRVRSLSASIAATNTAIGRAASPAVPNNH